LEEDNESDHSGENNESPNKGGRIFQVSERLYKKKEKENNELPFERVVEKGK
jgi:hypothetical protein